MLLSREFSKTLIEIFIITPKCYLIETKSKVIRNILPVCIFVYSSSFLVIPM